MDDAERKLRKNIEEFGCQVMHIAAEDDLPPFSYSVGIPQASNAPEVVVIGLKQPMAHFIVNEYNNRIRSGEKFIPGEMYEGFIGGFEVLLSVIDKAHYDEYFGMNLRLYDGPNFDVVQLIYPNTSGVWPWAPEADDWFRSWQPILSVATNDSRSSL
jgi:hypothetical protein